MAITHFVTADELLAMGKDAPYELMDGVLKEFPWSGVLAGVIGAQLVSALDKFVQSSQLGYVTGGKAGYVLSRNPDTVVAPNIGFVRHARFPDGLPDRGFCPTPPDLAIEVISFDDMRADIEQKQRLYTRAGVPLVWLVDPEARTVTVYRLGAEPEVLDESMMLEGEDIVPGFSLPVERVFAVKRATLRS
jgi:Uma2 family endonuclease